MSSSAASSRSDAWTVTAGVAADVGVLATGVTGLGEGTARCNRRIHTFVSTHTNTLT